MASNGIAKNVCWLTSVSSAIGQLIKRIPITILKKRDLVRGESHNTTEMTKALSKLTIHHSLDLQDYIWLW